MRIDLALQYRDVLSRKPVYITDSNVFDESNRYDCRAIRDRVNIARVMQIHDRRVEAGGRARKERRLISYQSDTGIVYRSNRNVLYICFVGAARDRGIMNWIVPRADLRQRYFSTFADAQRACRDISKIMPTAFDKSRNFSPARSPERRIH